MFDRFKKALQLARKYVWLVLASLYPVADQILAGIEAQMPTLQPYLGAAAFRYVGLAIVLAKLALQAWRALDKVLTLAARRVETGNDHD